MRIEELKKYIKRKLGYPVINIEIGDTQLSDVISDAFEMYSEFHMNGVDIGYIIHDLITNQTEYILDQTIREVWGVVSSGYNTVTDEPLLLTPFYLGNEDLGGSFNLISVEIFRQNMANVKNYLEKEIAYEFNPTTKKFTVFETPIKNQKIALHVYKGHETPSLIYTDMWFKKYCVALAGVQWGTNLSKYSGGKMPGGIEFNTEIYSRYLSQKDLLEEELYDRFTEPPEPFIG
jgi:hypothetical protein